MQAVDSTIKNIYFYSPRSTAFKVLENHLYLNTTPLYLNGHLQRTRPDLAKAVTWSKIDFFKKTQSQLIEQIELLNIDILCISLYIWNLDALDTIRGIKQLLSRPLTIMVGGPSCDAYRDPDYLNKHPDIDYAVFSQGEQAFVNILEHEIENRKLSPLTSSNLFWRQNNTIKKSQFKFLKPGHTSPFLENKPLLEQIVQDPLHKDYIFIVPYETSKGCVHACTFCDWTSGITHQAGHRTFDIEAELDLLGSLGLVTFHPSDANFGQHKQDIVIAKTMAKLKRTKGYDFFIRDTNLSKTKKHQAFEALSVLLEANIVKKAKFAIQDIHPHVLENVHRPDMPWPEHSAMIAEIKELYPDSTCEIELVIGLPGQTRQSWQDTLIAMQQFQVTAYPWMLLPNSPAGYDKDYQRKMGLQFMGLKLSRAQAHNDVVVVGSYSYDFRDYCYFTLLARLLNWRFIAAIRPRELLFSQINQSQHLEQVLDDMVQGHLEKNPDHVDLTIKKFIDILFTEVDAWDADTLLEYQQFKSGTVKPQRFWTDVKPKLKLS